MAVLRVNIYDGDNTELSPMIRKRNIYEKGKVVDPFASQLKTNRPRRSYTSLDRLTADVRRWMRRSGTSSFAKKHTGAQLDPPVLADGVLSTKSAQVGHNRPPRLGQPHRLAGARSGAHPWVVRWSWCTHAQDASYALPLRMADFEMIVAAALALDAVHPQSGEVLNSAGQRVNDL